MTAKYLSARASGLALGWFSLRLTVKLGLWLGIRIADLNPITDLKLSILAPIQITDLNLTPSVLAC